MNNYREPDGYEPNFSMPCRNCMNPCTDGGKYCPIDTINTPEGEWADHNATTQVPKQLERGVF